jgi:hypothetical protein
MIGIGAVVAAVSTNFLGFRDFLQNLGRDIGNAGVQTITQHVSR